MTLQEAETLALSTLKQVMEEKLDNKNVELASTRADNHKFRIYSTAELEAVIQRI